MEYEKIKELYGKKVFPFYEDGRVNIFGIRNGYEVTDQFDDLIGVARYKDGKPELTTFKATTDAGRVFVLNPVNVKGTGILIPGFHRDIWEIGLHNGRYEALIQTGGPVTVYRDNNRDGVYDRNPGSVDTGYFGINCHHKGYPGEAAQVGNSSAACQVLESMEEFISTFMPMMREDTKKGFIKKSYALFDLPDLQLIAG